MNAEIKETLLGVAVKLEDTVSKTFEIVNSPFPETHLTILNNIPREKTMGKITLMGFYSDLRSFISRSEAFLTASKSKQLVNPTNNSGVLYVKDLKVN